MNRLPAVVAIVLVTGSADRSEASIAEQSKALVPAGPWPQGDERGMANTMGSGALLRCGYYVSQPGAKTYELSYERSNTMPHPRFLSRTGR